MKTTGKKCSNCKKDYLCYEQIAGMRLKVKDENKKGTYVYNTYCLRCSVYGTEKAPND